MRHANGPSFPQGIFLYGIGPFVFAYNELTLLRNSFFKKFGICEIFLKAKPIYSAEPQRFYLQVYPYMKEGCFGRKDIFHTYP